MWGLDTLVWFAVGVAIGVGMQSTVDFINKQIDKNTKQKQD